MGCHRDSSAEEDRESKLNNIIQNNSSIEVDSMNITVWTGEYELITARSLMVGIPIHLVRVLIDQVD